ncbi:MAG: cytochrome c peroxidase [Planctomycetota bacterium]
MSRPESILSALLLLTFAALPAAAQRPSVPMPDEPVPFDDAFGRALDFDTSAVRPIAFSQDEQRLYVINSSGARLASFDVATFTRVGEIAIGLGAASVVRRPGTDELWVVDRVGSCVDIVDPALGAIVRTIRVGAEPHSLVFDPSGTRAWVTCSAQERVDVVRTSDYSVVRSLRIQAEGPRGITFSNGAAWCVPLLSGNNTAPRGTLADPNDVRTVERVVGPGLVPLPDRDLFRVLPGAQPTLDRIDPGATQTGLGTILFDVVARPGTNELWIPNTDALNSERTGERDFVDGQVVRNRITIADATGAAPRIVDLDALAPAGAKCAQPTGLDFDPVRPRAYVCSYGSDLVTVLDVSSSTPAWLGVVRIPAKQVYPRGSGPRTCVVDSAGQFLYVYLQQDKALARIDLAALPASGPFDVAVGPGANLGFELLSGAERLGRHLFNEANLSKSGTSSCASCHVDGHTDGLAWDLSNYLDPQGTARDLLHLGVDVKGPLVTQSTVRLEETGPYHWRGEKRRLEEFNASFTTLLAHEVGGVPSDIGGDFQYLKHYVNRLALLPNPRQRLDRSWSQSELRGAQLFRTKPVLNGLACADCHTLPLGSSGEVLAETAPGVLGSADVPSLRGVADKLSAAHTIGGTFGTRTELGAGLMHGGAFATLHEAARLEDAAGTPRFALTPQEAMDVESFLLAFDTGIAPAAAYQATAHAANASAVETNELATLMEEARRGRCDLVALRTPALLPSGGFQLLAALYEPATGHFLQASSALPFLVPHQLIVEAQTGRPVTFLGVPRGTGLWLALDRDLDGLYDLDELALGLSPEFGNQDLDAFPDGYEVRWVLDPFVFTPTSACPDTQPPHLVRPVRLVYATTNTLKFEFETDEVCQALIAANGQYPVQRLPLAAHKDTYFSVVLNDLEPDTDYVLDLTFKDPKGNTFVDHSARFRTRPRVVAAPACIGAMDLSVAYPPTGPTAQCVVDLSLGSVPAGAGYVVLGSLYYEDAAGVPTAVHADLTHVTDASGRAVFRVALASLPVTGSGRLLFVVHDVTAPPGAAAYVRAYDTATTASISY